MKLTIPKPDQEWIGNLGHRLIINIHNDIVDMSDDYGDYRCFYLKYFYKYVINGNFKRYES